MKVSIKRIDHDYLLEAENDTSNTLLMDGNKHIGGNEAGMRPMQLLLAAVGGCSAIDVISILKKQKQEIETFEMEVIGDKVSVESHSEFKTIDLHFKMTGTIEPIKALKAAELSHNKYCSVSKALEHHTVITYSVSINGRIAEK